MSDKQQKTDSRETEQQQLMAFATEGRSESPMTVVEGTVSLEVDSNLESPTSSDGHGSNGRPANVGSKSYENWASARILPLRLPAAAKAVGTTVALRL